MIKKIIISILILTSSQVSAQFKLFNDDYNFRRDTGLNYNVYVKNNDTGAKINLVKIYRIQKLGVTAANYKVEYSPDSFYIRLLDSTNSTYSGSFMYYGIDPTTSVVDSATVTFNKIDITPEVYPGETNKDNLVNHLDLFAIGMFYGEKGDSRHNQDTNTIFTPKRISNWDKFIGTVNGKYADIDGNSIVDIKDYDKLNINLGKTSGNYSPKLSDTTTLNTLNLGKIQDTVFLPTDTSRLNINILFNSSTPINSYGLAYSIRIDNRNKATGQDTFYPKYNILGLQTRIWNDQTTTLTFSDKLTKAKNTNVSYVRTNGKNGGMTGEAGIVEVVTDEILIGMAASGETIARLNVYISDICLIDNSYNTIPCKPISKTVYLKRGKASINSSQENKITAYPTQIGSAFIIERSNLKPQAFVIYNSIGQVIESGILKSDKTRLENINWTSGIYYLKVENSTEVIRLQKQ
jgi:hypothetical protein